MMKNRKRFSVLIAVASFLIFLQPKNVLGQFNDLGTFIRAGVDDAETLIRAYIDPLANGVGANLNSGWFTDASPHATLGFSIQIRGAVAFVPSSDQTFDLSKLPLNRIQAADPSSTLTPTLGGKDAPGAKVIVAEDGEKLAQFKLPGGTGIHFVPTPMVQASVGLIKNTDVTVRFVPKVNINEYGYVQLWGVGLRHELTQWLPGSKFIPITVSIFGGYSHVDITSPLNIKPQSNNSNNTSDYSNQKALMAFDAYTAKLIVGKDLPFISVYGAVGYEYATMTAQLKGNYPIPIKGPNGTVKTKTVHNPIQFEEEGNNTFSVTAGVKFSLFFFNIYGQYTKANYSIVNAGIGFSFR